MVKLTYNEKITMAQKQIHILLNGYITNSLSESFAVYLCVSLDFAIMPLCFRKINHH